jgi:hypothetical protein
MSTETSTPTTSTPNQKSTGLVANAAWFAAAAALIGSGYGAAYKLQIVPLESDKTLLRADLATSQARVEKLEIENKASSKNLTDAQITVMRVQASVDGSLQTVGDYKTELAKSQTLVGQYQRSYTMAYHLLSLREQQIYAQNILRRDLHSETRTVHENEVTNLQKQIEAATKCSL